MSDNPPKTIHFFGGATALHGVHAVLSKAGWHVMEQGNEDEWVAHHFAPEPVSMLSQIASKLLNRKAIEARKG